MKVFLRGGLGNQLFQLAFARLLVARGFSGELDFRFSSHSGQTYRDYSLGGILGMPGDISRMPGWIELLLSGSARILKRLPVGVCYGLARWGVLIEREGGALDLARMLHGVKRVRGRLVAGYWQDGQFLFSEREVVCSFFRLESHVDSMLDEMAGALCLQDSVVVHVRRGDYFSDERVRAVYGVCDESYLLSGLRVARERSGCARAVVFSDDIEWCERLFGSVAGVTIFREPISPLETLSLMSRGGAFVLSNSTFGWWAAFLGINAKCVVVPRWWKRGRLTRETGLLGADWVEVD